MTLSLALATDVSKERLQRKSLAHSYLFFLLYQIINALPSDGKRYYKRRDLPEPPDDYDNNKDTWERKVSARCTTDQLASEARGWAEAGILANAIDAWKPREDYQNAMDMYMGTDSAFEKPYYYSSRARVQQAVRQDHKIHIGEPPLWTYVFVYCDEDEIPKEWEKSCTGNVGAYTWESLGLWSNHYVVLCPDNFLDPDVTPSLATELQRLKNDTSKAKDISQLEWNLGAIYFHETFHWQDTVTKPKAWDFDPDDSKRLIYGAKAVIKIAKEKNTHAASVIADAYTFAGTAMLMMQVFKLEDSPEPLSVSAATEKKFTLLDKDKAPEGWIGAMDVNDRNSQPDPEKWIKPIRVQIDMDPFKPIAEDKIADGPPPPRPASEPKCGDHGYTMPLAAVKDVNDQLNADGDGKQCCTTDDGGCTTAHASQHFAVDLCSAPGVKLCVGCGTVGKYVAELMDKCKQGEGDDVKVGGTQDIVETPGLQVQI